MDRSNSHRATTLSETLDSGLEPFVRLLRVDVAGDVLEVVDGTWALHGVIPLDGNVLLAEFDSYDDARRALDAFTAEPADRPTLHVDPDEITVAFDTSLVRPSVCRRANTRP